MPVAACRQLVLYEVEYGSNLFRLRVEVPDITVNGILKQCLAIERNLHISIQLKFFCKAAQYGLKESIYRLNAKVTIIVQNQFKCFACIFDYCLPADSRQLLNQFLKVVISIVQSIGNTIQFAQYTLFHFACSLVCKGHGKYVAVRIWVLHQQLHIFKSQGEGFSGTSRCSVYLQCSLHISLMPLLFQFYYVLHFALLQQP